MKQSTMNNVYGSLAAFAIVLTVVAIKAHNNDQEQAIAASDTQHTQEAELIRDNEQSQANSPFVKTSASVPKN